MAAKSSIEWTHTTWNPVTGCNKISPGCKNCYAEKMAFRLMRMGQQRYRNGFEVTLQYDALVEPFKWKAPRLVFVNSMSDLFHEDIPEAYLNEVFSVMHGCPRHQFQVLTKRSDRLKKFSTKVLWTSNIWMGVSVESEKYCFRIDDLRSVPATVRFLSIEPLLGPIPNLNLAGIHWVIVGGESGPRSRHVKERWILEIRDECLRQNVPFFFKQWGGTRRKKAGRLLEEREWNQMPVTVKGPNWL